MKCLGCGYKNRPWALTCSLCGEVLGKESEATPWKRLPSSVRREILARSRTEAGADRERARMVRGEMVRTGLLTSLFLVIFPAFGEGLPRGALPAALTLVVHSLLGLAAGVLVVRRGGGVYRGFLYLAAAYFPFLLVRHSLGWAGTESIFLGILVGAMALLPAGGLIGLRTHQFYEDLR